MVTCGSFTHNRRSQFVLYVWKSGCGLGGSVTVPRSYSSCFVPSAFHIIIVCLGRRERFGRDAGRGCLQLPSSRTAGTCRVPSVDSLLVRLSSVQAGREGGTHLADTHGEVTREKRRGWAMWPLVSALWRTGRQGVFSAKLAWST